MSLLDLCSLKSLSIQHCNLTPEDCELLAKWPAFSSVVELDVSRNEIGDRGAKAVMTAVWTELRVLQILSTG